jgi:hypothetical protein
VTRLGLDSSGSSRRSPPVDPDHQRYLGSELDLADAACDRLGIRLSSKGVA